MIFALWDAVRRRLAAREPFPSAWREILERRVPFYRVMDAETRLAFEHKLKIFVRTKSFEGARGFRIDDEVRVVIGATAARLVTNLPHEHYEDLVSIIVYPSHYKHPDGHGAGTGGIVFGEANDRGSVVLSWDAVVHGLANPKDGHDTATHEFAHVLDIEDGAMDGTPELPSEQAYAKWARVMTSAYAGLRRRKSRARPVLRDYGATNEAEFFAVATEAFFEKPSRMKQEQPALYAVLSDFYRCDPAAGAR
jgi:Mlc titration factor MtfA (ptsG expression regulator)